MEEISLKARAKINLSLDVTGVRPNGYHDVRMVMQSIGTYDSLIMKKTEEEGLVIKSNMAFLEQTDKNLAARAYEMLKDEYDLPGGMLLKLQKTIPIAAGTAGGSSDAAAVLYGVNRLYNLNLSTDQLCEYGQKLGADVPFCLIRGTVLAEGIGEKLTVLPAAPACHLVTAKPSISVSTKWVYETLDSKPIEKHPDVDGMIEAIKEQDLAGIVSCMGNVLENVTIPEYPVVAQIKEKLMEYGAMGAMMSGSGPTVFGIFDTEEKAAKACALLRKTHLAVQVFVTGFYNPGGGYYAKGKA